MVSGISLAFGCNCLSLASVKGKYGGTAERSGYFKFFAAKEIFVQRWNKQLEMPFEENEVGQDDVRRVQDSKRHHSFHV